MPDQQERIARVLHRLMRPINRMLGQDFVAFQGALLPPPHLRYCGARFRDDATFLESGREEARRLVRDFSVDESTSILEVGCGPGRLPIGILAEGLRIARYDGVDIDDRALRWCQRYLSRGHREYQFHIVRAGHRRYNPRGPAMDEEFRLPLQTHSYDLIYLHSVFANLEPNDVRVYLSEFRRLLRPAGQVFLTAFIEDGVPDCTIDPTDYHVVGAGVLTVARYERSFFMGMLEDAGLELASFEHATELDGQSAVVARPRR